MPLLLNPFAPVEIERIDIDVKATFQSNFGEIRSIRVPSSELQPGGTNFVMVRMRTFNGEDIIERIPFDVPSSLAGSIVKLEVSSGDAAKLDVAPPENLRDLVRGLREVLPGNVFAVTVNTADEGVAVEGKLIRDLPASALDRLRVLSSTPISARYHPITRSTYKSRRVIVGAKSVLIKVADKPALEEFAKRDGASPTRP